MLPASDECWLMRIFKADRSYLQNHNGADITKLLISLK